MDRQKKGAEVSYQIVHLHDFVEQPKKNYMSMSKTLLVRSSSTRKNDGLTQTTITAPNGIVIVIIERKSAKNGKWNDTRGTDWSAMIGTQARTNTNTRRYTVTAATVGHTSIRSVSGANDRMNDTYAEAVGDHDEGGGRQPSTGAASYRTHDVVAQFERANVVLVRVCATTAVHRRSVDVAVVARPLHNGRRGREFYIVCTRPLIFTHRSRNNIYHHPPVPHVRRYVIPWYSVVYDENYGRAKTNCFRRVTAAQAAISTWLIILFFSSGSDTSPKYSPLTLRNVSIIECPFCASLKTDSR